MTKPTVEQAVKELKGSWENCLSVLATPVTGTTRICYDKKDGYYLAQENSQAVSAKVQVVCSVAEFANYQWHKYQKGLVAMQELRDKRGGKAKQGNSQGEWVDGLPPVDSEIEYQPATDLWVKAKVIAHIDMSRGKAIVIYDPSTDDVEWILGTDKIRKPLSERDKAIEEAWNEVSAIHSVNGCRSGEKKTFQEAIGDMIDCGYRKQRSRSEAKESIEDWVTSYGATPSDKSTNELLEALGWERD